MRLVVAAAIVGIAFFPATSASAQSPVSGTVDPSSVVGGVSSVVNDPSAIQGLVPCFRVDSVLPLSVSFTCGFNGYPIGSFTIRVPPPNPS